MILLHRGVGGAKLGAGLLESRAGGQASKQLRHAMDPSGDHGGRQVMRAADDVRDDLGIGGIRHGWFQHTDDGGHAGGAAAFQAHGFSNHRRIALEHGGPESIGEHHRGGGLRTVVAHVEQTAQHGVETHDVEIRAADYAGADFPRLAQSDHGEADGGKIAERVEGFDARLQILDFRDQKSAFSSLMPGALWRM